MSKPRILLISFGQFEKEFLDRIAKSISVRFGIHVDVTVNYIDLSDFYDPARRQYDGNKLLKFIHTEYVSENQKVIGLFRVDLFIPVLTYIIGQAVFKGNAGVVSLFRLKNELYGMESNQTRLFERFQKEIIHELGHEFGLTHCFSPSCVMRSSTYIEEVDQKNATFCFSCYEKLQTQIR